MECLLGGEGSDLRGGGFESGPKVLVLVRFRPALSPS